VVEPAAVVFPSGVLKRIPAIRPEGRCLSVGRVGLKTTYQYDAADRVSSIAYTKPDNTPVESVSYAYDAGGQRISKTEGQQAPGDTAFSATYDQANRLANITIAGELFTLTYDDNGNLTTKTGPVSGATNYGWSARNQLLSLSSPAGSATFKYDAMGRRTEKTVNGQTTGFLYDGAQAIAELRGSSIDTVYHTGVAIDEVLARYAPTGNKTLLTDALMSVIAQTNDAGNADNYYAYSPYGEATTLGPDGGNSLQYTGRENDGSGLYYYRARYYDSVLKRFVSEDPIGLEAGPNFFAYVRGNPTNLIDPLGYADVGMHAAGIGPRTQEDYARIAAANSSRKAYKKCIDDYLRNEYGDFFGYWLADDLVPSFSAYSYIDPDTYQQAYKTSVKAVIYKGSAVGALKLLGATALAGAATTAAIGGSTLLGVFATTAHRAAQLSCSCPQ